jgi:hypothetical protein
MSLIDGILNMILGPDTHQMNEEDRKKTENAREADKKDASQMAASARKNPGAQWMDGPESAGIMGGGDLMDSIGKVMKLFSGGGG